MFGLSEVQTGDRRNIPALLKGLARMPMATMPWWKSLAMMNENKGVFGLNMLQWWDREGPRPRHRAAGRAAGRRASCVPGRRRELPLRPRRRRPPLPRRGQERRQGRARARSAVEPLRALVVGSAAVDQGGFRVNGDSGCAERFRPHCWRRWRLAATTAVLASGAAAAGRPGDHPSRRRERPHGGRLELRRHAHDQRPRRRHGHAGHDHDLGKHGQGGNPAGARRGLRRHD